MAVRLEHANLFVRDIEGMIRFLQTAFSDFRVRGESIYSKCPPGRRSRNRIEYSQAVRFSHEKTVNPVVKYGTAIVLAHLMVNIIHGAAHRQLRVELGPVAMLFVIGSSG